MGQTAHAPAASRRQSRPVANVGDLRRLLILVAAFAAALVAVVGAGADDSLRVGVADDWPAFHPCGDVWWQSASDIGFRELRLTVQWDGTPAIVNQGGLQTAVACAALAGVQPVLAVYPARPALIGGDPVAQRAFAQFVALVGETFPRVDDFVVGNEPNVNRFWQPQFRDGVDAAARDYEHTLARAYDALKLVRPDASVWGPAISSRGNDSPRATSNPGHSPVEFIEEMGAAYRASHRTRPIFDEFDMHPYPRVQDTDSYAMPFQWPQAGAANLDRIKQALWDAFHGTAQPVPAEQPAGVTPAAGTLPIDLDEVGSQTTIADADVAAYTDGPESIVPITPGQQAAFYLQLVRIAACDPDVHSLLFFELIDDPDLAHGFQSGELYADGAHKQSYDVLKQALAVPGDLCTSGVETSWRHTTQVVGATAGFASRPTALGRRVWRLQIHAQEAASYRAGILRVMHSRIPTSDTVERALSSARPRLDLELADAISGSLRAYARPSISFDPSALPPGTYVCGITLAAAADPARTSTFVSRPFRVRTRRVAGAPPARSAAAPG